jgi:hypothetical protein
MSTTHRYTDDGDDNVLKDGQRVRVPMVAMDSTQRQVREHFGKVMDGFGRSNSELLHRPGQRFSEDSFAIDEKIKAYADYEADLTTAWRGGNPPIKDAGENLRGYPREGDQCTVRGPEYPDQQGAPGHIQGGVCVPDADYEDARRRKRQYRDPEGREEGSEEETKDSRSTRDREEAYREYEAELVNAWRGGK